MANPFNAASPYLNQVVPMAENRLNPYINRGNEAGDLLHGEYQNLVNNPYGKYEDIFNNYTPSGGFKLQLDQAMKAMQNSAAAGGYAGTEADQFRQADLARQLASQDFQNYFNNITGLYGTGLEGEQGFSDQGYGATESLTGIEGDTLGTQAGLAFQGASQKNANRNSLAKALIQALGTAGGAYLGGLAGGPAGAGAGASLGGKLANGIW